MNNVTETADIYFVSVTIQTLFFSQVGFTLCDQERYINTPLSWIALDTLDFNILIPI